MGHRVASPPFLPDKREVLFRNPSGVKMVVFELISGSGVAEFETWSGRIRDLEVAEFGAWRWQNPSH